MPNYNRISNLNESDKINNLKEKSIYYFINLKGNNDIRLPILFCIIKNIYDPFYFEIVKLSECIKNDIIECKTFKNYIGSYIKSFILLHDGIASLYMNSINILEIRYLALSSKRIENIRKYSSKAKNNYKL